MSNQTITPEEVQRHALTSPANTRPHRMARVLTERFGWTVETALAALVFGDEDLLEQAYMAVTLKQPQVLIPS